MSTTKTSKPAAKRGLNLAGTTLTLGSIRQAIRSSGLEAKSSGMVFVDPAAIRRIPGFNVRERTESYLAHIENIAQSMEVDGFYPDKPLSGFVAKVMVDGKPQHVLYILDGHTRLEAAGIAISRGAPIATVPIILRADVGDAVDVTVSLARANGGSRPLTPLESSEVVRRLLEYGLREPEIAARMGCTGQYVRDLVLLIRAPAQLRDKVKAGELSATLAIQLTRKHGANVVGAVEEAEQRAKASGKDRITKRHSAIAKRPAPDRIAEPSAMDLIRAVQNDPAFGNLAADLRQRLSSLCNGSQDKAHQLPGTNLAEDLRMVNEAIAMTAQAMSKLRGGQPALSLAQATSTDDSLFTAL